MGSEDPETVSRSLAIAEKAIRFCTDTGIRQIQLAGYDVRYEGSTEKTRERSLKNLKKAARDLIISKFNEAGIE